MSLKLLPSATVVAERLCFTGVCLSRGEVYTPRQTPQSWAEPPPWQPQRTVRILLECILVFSYFYRPQRSWGKVMFLHVSVILFTGGGGGGGTVCPTACWDTPPPQRSAYWEIWATSGQYASYWNAILLLPANEVSGTQCFQSVQ